jgi:hypothetical protein
MILHRQQITDGSATAKALDYSLRRWGALTRFIGNGQLPIDNNHIENQIRPIAIGRNNWLFAGSLRAGKGLSKASFDCFIGTCMSTVWVDNLYRQVLRICTKYP